MQDTDAWDLAPLLDLADKGLAHPSPLCHLSLGQSRDGASGDEFAGKSRCNISGRSVSDARSGHGPIVAGTRDRRVTADLPRRLLGCAT